MIIERAISIEAPAATPPTPQAFWRIIAIPPEDGQTRVMQA